MASADTTSQTPTRAVRLDALDGLRGIAALAVLVLHVWMFNYGDAGRPPKGVGDLIAGELRIGVLLFFVLSGYLLYRPFVGAVLDGAPRPHLGRYAIRRAARILPAYAAALAGSFWLLRHLDHPLQVDLSQLPIFLLFAQNQVEATAKHLDPPMWTLAVEVSFYVLLPAVALLAARLGPHRGRQLLVPAAFVAVGLACVAAAALQQWPATISTSLLLHLAEFGVGMAVATLLHQRALPRAAAAGLAVAGVLLVVANSWWHAVGLGPQQTRAVVGDAPGALGFALVVAGIVAGSWRARLLTCTPVRWLGTVSYGVYLAHFPVIVGLRGFDRWPETLAGELLAVTAISMALATASWLLLERPAIRWARRVTARPPEHVREPQPRDTVPAIRHRRPAHEPRVLRPQPVER